MTSPGYKTCRECGHQKPGDVFVQRPAGKPWCKDCYNAYYRRARAAQSPEQRARRLQATRDWFQKNPGYRGSAGKEWAAHIWRQYRLTLVAYEALVEQHNNRCAICGVEGTSEERLCVDHCHTTGTVRGMLCRKHNMAIGKFDDDPEMLERAAAYLRQRGSTPAISN
jgi:hypothetical protein